MKIKKFGKKKIKTFFCLFYFILFFFFIFLFFASLLLYLSFLFCFLNL